MEEKNYTDLIARYLAGDLSEEKENTLMEWVEADANNQALFDELLEVWSFTGEHQPQIKVDSAAAWEKVSTRLPTSIAEAAPAKVVSINKWKPLLRIAAVALLVISVSYWLLNKETTTTELLITAQTMDNERKSVELPDGSTVWLNENTLLSYTENFEPRVVSLKGEAFFDVVKKNGQSFEIKSGEMTTSVLGTSFNVRAYPGEKQVEVTVETGKVALSSNAGTKERVLLVAGESGTYDKPAHKLLKTSKKILNANAWQTRTISFKDMELVDVIPLLERYFDVEIETSKPEILRCPFTVDNAVNPKINNILDAMAFGLELEIEPRQNGFLLKGKGCR